MSITGAAIWINPFVGILTVIALWPVSIIFMHLRTTLRTLKIIPKYAMYQVRSQTNTEFPSTAPSAVNCISVLMLVAGADPEPAADGYNQHLGHEWRYRLLSAFFVSRQRIQWVSTYSIGFFGLLSLLNQAFIFSLFAHTLPMDLINHLISQPICFSVGAEIQAVSF